MAPLEGVDAVVNLVGRNHETRNYSLYDANVLTAGAVAEAAREADVKTFVQASSLAAREDSPVELYRCKWAAEQVVRSVFDDAIIVRMANVIGVGDRCVTVNGERALPFGVYPLLFPDRKLQPISAVQIGQCFAKIVMNRDANLERSVLYGDRVVNMFALFGKRVFTEAEFDSKCRASVEKTPSLHAGRLTPFIRTFIRSVGKIMEKIPHDRYRAVLPIDADDDVDITANDLDNVEDYQTMDDLIDAVDDVDVTIDDAMSVYRRSPEILY